MGTRISVSIVSYNSEMEIEKVLDSLHNSSLILDMKIYVVDNASADKTVSIVRTKYAGVKSICLNINVGFGSGHNKAINDIDTEYHIMVNPDIIVGKDVVEQLADYMDKNEHVVITTPKILNIDGTEQFLPKRNPRIKYFIGGRFEKYGRIFGKWRAEYTRSNETITMPVEIDFCTGCFMFCRTSALKQCGGFDERYFLHFEDADLTREMKKYGKTVFNPNIEVVHGWKRDNVKSLKIFKIALKSMFQYFAKWGLK